MLKKNIKNFDIDSLKVELEKIGEKKYRAEQIFKWLFQVNVQSFDEMTNLSIELRKKLEELFVVGCFKIEKKLVSKDGTKKYLFDIQDKGQRRQLLYHAVLRACQMTRLRDEQLIC